MRHSAIRQRVFARGARRMAVGVAPVACAGLAGEAVTSVASFHSRQVPFRSDAAATGRPSLPPGESELTPTIKTTAVFAQAFELPSFNETLPAGEYEIEAERLEPVDRIEPGSWTSSVLVHLHPRASHPGLTRTLTVPLAELERAVAKDKLTGKALTDFFLEEMLADPLIRLVMQADGIAEAEVRATFLGQTDMAKDIKTSELGQGGPSNGERADRGTARPEIGE